MPSRCASSPSPRPLPRHRVVAVKSAREAPRYSHAVPFLLLRPPLLSLFCCASRSPRRGNPHAHRSAIRDVPTRATPLRSPGPSSFIMTLAMPSNGVRFSASTMRGPRLSTHVLGFPSFVLNIVP
ncbi:hypothetical protein B0H14DRAFT_3896427, partial [Mycena olivaceomarginata]